MSRDDVSLRSFCHINEFDPSEYGRIQEMAVTSRPLVIWAPVRGRLVRASPGLAEDVAVHRFLNLVDHRHVRIIGREWWLSGSAARRNHAWREAQDVDNAFDRTLWRWAIDDAALSPQDRRVVVAPDDDGAAHASRLLEEHPEVVARVDRMLRRKAVRPFTPEEVLRFDTPDGRVRAALRTARNHGIAMRDSNAELSFLGRGTDAFLGALRTSLKSILEPAEVTLPSAQTNLGEAARLLLQEIAQGPADGLYLGSSIHLELVSWLRAAAEHVTASSASASYEQLRAVLATEMRGGVERRLRELIGAGTSGVATVMFLLGIIVDVLDFVDSGPSPLTIAGTTLAALPAMTGLLRWMGILEPSYSGPQWPFYLRSRTGFNSTSHAELLSVLDPTSGFTPA